MNWIAAAVLLSGVTTPRSEGVRTNAPAPPAARDIGAEVRGVFADRCADCHGPDLAKPKGRFGYVLDLRRVAGNPEMVVPGRPEESELWALVRRNEMPPPDSSHGPLTGAEKETIRAWIAAGAPDGVAPPSNQEGEHAPFEPPAQRTLRWLGKLHLLLLHFPIALVLAAGFGELLSACRGSREPSRAAGFCLSLAAVAVVPTVAFGWLHAAAGNGVGSHQLLTVHRWLGTAAGVWVIGTALCAMRDVRRGVRRRGVRVALFVAALLVVATSHVGGSMAHGRDYFDW